MTKKMWAGMIATALILTGCWGTGGEPSGMPGKIVGVYNAFPDHPLYLKNKTLVAGQDSREIEGLSLKSYLTGAVVQFLEAKGYRTVVVDQPSALDTGEADMLIEVLPRQVHKIEGMVGYGFSDREILWGLVKQPASSFVALQITLKRKNSLRVIKTSPEERFSQLEGRALPDTWGELTQEEKAVFEENLRENMGKAVYLSLSRLKI